MARAAVVINVGWVPGISTLQTLGRAGEERRRSVEAVAQRDEELDPGVLVVEPSRRQMARIRMTGAETERVVAVVDCMHRHSLAPARGVNLAHIAYCDVAREPLSPREMRRNARTRWATTLKADRRPVPQRPPYVDPLLAKNDPRLALAHVSRLVHLRQRRRRLR